MQLLDRLLNFYFLICGYFPKNIFKEEYNNADEPLCIPCIKDAKKFASLIIICADHPKSL